MSFLTLGPSQLHMSQNFLIIQFLSFCFCNSADQATSLVTVKELVGEWFKIKTVDT